jgi:hypothetical protein
MHQHVRAGGILCDGGAFPRAVPESASRDAKEQHRKFEDCPSFFGGHAVVADTASRVLGLKSHESDCGKIVEAENLIGRLP